MNALVRVARIAGSCCAVLALAAGPSSLSPSLADYDLATNSEGIAHVIAGSRSRISALRFTVVRRDKGPEGGEAVESARETFAFNGDKRYLEVVRKRKNEVVTTSTVQVVDGKEQVVEEERVVPESASRSVRVFDGFYLLMRGNGNIVQLESLASLGGVRGSRFASMYFQTIGWYLRDPMAPDAFERDRQARAIPECFLGKGYRISKERLGVVDAVKLEGAFRTEPYEGLAGFDGTEELWLDEKRGYMLVRRRIFNKATSQLASELEATEPIQLAEGCWIPGQCTERYWKNGEPIETQLEIVEWNVGDFDGSIFKVEVPPNVMVTDFAETAKRRLPLEKPLVRYSSGDGALMDRPLKVVFAERRRRRWSMIFCANVLLVVAAIAVRRWRRARVL